MKYLIFLLLLPSFVFAHPVDSPCPQGGEPCQETYQHLGLNNPTFFECHRQYWHFRRVVNETIRKYSECIGAVNEQHRVRGWLPVEPNQTILNYWDVIPAHPVADKAGDLVACGAQLESAIFTDNLFIGWTSACEVYLAILRGGNGG